MSHCSQRVNTPLLSGCCQAVKKLSTSCQEKKYFLPKHIFSSQQTKILTLTQKFPKIETDEIFRVAVKKLSTSCQEKKYLLLKQIFSSQQTKILTLTQKFPKIETDEISKWLSRSCQEAVNALSARCRARIEGKSFEYGSKKLPVCSAGGLH